MWLEMKSLPSGNAPTTDKQHAARAGVSVSFWSPSSEGGTGRSLEQLGSVVREVCLLGPGALRQHW